MSRTSDVPQARSPSEPVAPPAGAMVPVVPPPREIAMIIIPPGTVFDAPGPGPTTPDAAAKPARKATESKPVAESNQAPPRHARPESRPARKAEPEPQPARKPKAEPPSGRTRQEPRRAPSYPIAPSKRRRVLWMGLVMIALAAGAMAAAYHLTS